MVKRIYLDHAATSPVHPEVIAEMTTANMTYFGNPSSLHYFGRESRKMIDNARRVCAASIGAKAKEIIFTGGGTESDNMFLFGIAKSYKHLGKHIITTEIEHPGILQACKELEKNGFEISYLHVDETGVIDIVELQSLLRDDTILVSIMFGNNEVGTLQPIQEIGQLLKSHQAFFHTDAVQAYGASVIDVETLGVDGLSISGHKINGPKGIGFLYCREGIKLKPLLFGGKQERVLRAGTENVPAILGLQKAVEITQENLLNRAEKYRSLKQYLLQKLSEEKVVFEINGSVENTLPHIINLYFPKTKVESFLVNLDLEGVSVSSGSACTAGSMEPSHVLVAMFGSENDRIQSSVRFSIGYGNTEEDIEIAASKIKKIIDRTVK